MRAECCAIRFSNRAGISNGYAVGESEWPALQLRLCRSSTNDRFACAASDCRLSANGPIAGGCPTGQLVCKAPQCLSFDWSPQDPENCRPFSLSQMVVRRSTFGRWTRCWKTPRISHLIDYAGAIPNRVRKPNPIP